MIDRQRIQSENCTVASLLQSFYTVLDYRREYVWDTDEVEQLLKDVREEMGDGDAQDAPEYFMGSIVVCPGRDGVLDLIDGQQRMTTLTLCYAPSGSLGGAQRTCFVRAERPDCRCCRGRIRRGTAALLAGFQYEDSGDALTSLPEGKAIEASSTQSMRNMQNGHGVALRFLHPEFGEDVKAVRKFYGYLTNKLKQIRIQTEDVAKVLKVFDTIADRGVGLNSMDLLKTICSSWRHQRAPSGWIPSSTKASEHWGSRSLPRR